MILTLITKSNCNTKSSTVLPIKISRNDDDDNNNNSDNGNDFCTQNQDPLVSTTIS